MKPAQLRACLREVSAAVGAALSLHRFDPEPSIIVGDRFTRRWQRFGAWKTEAVDIVHERERPSELRVDLRVLLPCPEGAETWLDGVAVGALLQARPTFRLTPRLGRVLPGHCARLGRALAADITRALGWFDSFATPADSLDLLRRGETSWGRARTAATRSLESYLEGIDG